jgi:hypothetical protein
MVADWSLAILPITIVWNLPMSRKTKLNIEFVLGLGSMCVFSPPPPCYYIPRKVAYYLRSSCVATIARFFYIAELQDITTLTPVIHHTLWLQIEVGMAIIASSVATLRPLIDKMVAICSCT